MPPERWTSGGEFGRLVHGARREGARHRARKRDRCAARRLLGAAQLLARLGKQRVTGGRRVRRRDQVVEIALRRDAQADRIEMRAAIAEHRKSGAFARREVRDDIVDALRRRAVKTAERVGHGGMIVAIHHPALRDLQGCTAHARFSSPCLGVGPDHDVRPGLRRLPKP